MVTGQAAIVADVRIAAGGRSPGTILTSARVVVDIEVMIKTEIDA